MHDPATFTTAAVHPRHRLPYWRDVVCETFVELDCECTAPDDFHGTLSTRRIGEMDLSQVVSIPQQVRRTRSRIAASNSDFLLLSLQVTGRGVVMQDGRAALLHPGDFALYDTTRPYDLRFDEDFEQLVLRLPRRVLAERLAEPEQLTARPISGDSGVGRMTFLFIQQLHAQIDAIDSLSIGRVHGTAVDLVATLLSEHARGSGSMRESAILLRRRVSAYIDANLADPQLSCEDIARKHGISERYLRRLFQDSAMSVSEWIWARRLEQASRDLVDPLHAHLSITAIGFDVGFKDAGHFSRAFKARFGMTPKSWRAQSAAKAPDGRVPVPHEGGIRRNR